MREFGGSIVDMVAGQAPSGNSVCAGEAPGGSGARRSRPRPPKMYRIGEIVDYSGLSRQTIHNYATMGLLRESKWTRGGHRLFDESVFERLDEVLQMKRANNSMQEIREHFAKMDGQS